VDMSYTPVLDLYHCDENKQVLSKVIGDRAFAKTGLQTTILANRLIAGLKQAGMRSCGKHFPGHGFACEDSHFDIARDSRELKQIMQEDVFPYQALGNLLDSIMPAHVIYEKADPAPAGFSSFWLQKVLRQDLHYQGYIFSDDLSMEGASIVGKTVLERAHKALAAGCDGVIICNRPDLSDELLEGLPQTIIDLAWQPKNIEDIQNRQKRLFAASRFTPYDWQGMLDDQAYQYSQSILREYTLILN
jgi:beta-N-acetylhexosaminidase